MKPLNRCFCSALLLSAFIGDLSAQSMPSRHPVGNPPFQISGASLLGDGSSENQVKVSAILGDGSILVGGHFGTPAFLNRTALAPGANRDHPWVLLRLTGDGRRILGGLRFPGPLSDLAVGAGEQVFIAAGSAGLFVYTPRLDRLVRHHDDIGFAYRVDAGNGGHYAVLGPSNIARREVTPGQGVIRVFHPHGHQLTQFSGHRHTLDIAIDEANYAVHHTGWRQARSWQPDGGTVLPVQIAYIRSVGFDGQHRWTGYDWGTTRGQNNFINNGDNNMADTRGYRATLGPDGRFYAAFEVAGGNHIFRYSPHNIRDRVTGRFARAPDHFHQFHNTRSEHKTFIGVYDPRDGSFITGQQFTTRLDSGRGNAWRMEAGGLTVAENGQVWFAGFSASGVPFTFAPTTAPNYTGGAVAHGMSPDLGTRLFGTYLGMGATHTISTRVLPGQRDPVVVFGGSAPPPRGDNPEYFLHHFPLQPARENNGTMGFFKVINGRGGQN